MPGLPKHLVQELNVGTVWPSARPGATHCTVSILYRNIHWNRFTVLPRIQHALLYTTSLWMDSLQIRNTKSCIITVKCKIFHGSPYCLFSYKGMILTIRDIILYYVFCIPVMLYFMHSYSYEI